MRKIRIKLTILLITIGGLFLVSPNVTLAQGYNIEMYSALVAKVASRLGLTGETAGDFAAIVVRNQGYRGFEVGKIIGALAIETNATGKETEQILAIVLNELNPEPDEADQIASTVELETGEKISVVRDTGVVEVPKARRVEDKLPENPLAKMLSNTNPFVDPYDGPIAMPDKVHEAPTSAAIVRFLKDVNRLAEAEIEGSSAPQGDGSTSIANGPSQPLSKADALRRILRRFGLIGTGDIPTPEQIIDILLGNEELEEEIVTSRANFQ